MRFSHGWRKSGKSMGKRLPDMLVSYAERAAFRIGTPLFDFDTL
jgi:hypothetical protein|tara:strand:- start:2973 stop:3104 length:132 start_codon:yes stop_codon:yes gene_type:complete